MTKFVLPKNIIKHNPEYSGHHPVTFTTIVNKGNTLPIKTLSHNGIHSVMVSRVSY